MVTQVEELLDHTLGKDEALKGMVGHSTGGVVAIQSSRALSSRKIERLALVSPALWADKPLVARLCDKAPNLLHRLFKSNVTGFKPLKFAVKDAYCKNCYLAFSKDPVTKQ